LGNLDVAPIGSSLFVIHGSAKYALVLLQLFLEKSNEARITFLRHCAFTIAQTGGRQVIPRGSMRYKLDARKGIAVYLITHDVIVVPVCVDDVFHRLRGELTQCR